MSAARPLTAALVVSLLLNAQRAHPQDASARMLSGFVTSPITFRGFGELRVLSDGRVLVDEPGNRRIVLLDANLANPVVVIDSAATGAARGYSARGGSLMPFIGDSTIYADLTANALVVIDPGGKVTRVFAPPRPSEMLYLFATGSYDGRDGFVYQMPMANPAPAAPPPGPIGQTARPESALIVRASIASHALDTVAYVRIAKTYPMSVGTDTNGTRVSRPVANPVPLSDDWALAPDGTIAILRSHDLHVDWIDAPGRSSASPSVRYAWHRLTDEDKAAIVDSMRAYWAARPQTSPARRGGPATVVVTQVPEPAELPDYGMPFAAGLTRVDPDGNLWLAPLPPLALPLATTDLVARTQRQDIPEDPRTYEIVNRAGTIIDRIRVPGGYRIVGFGRGTVYAITRVPNGYALMRAPVRHQ